jgi:hypothetical protein
MVKIIGGWLLLVGLIILGARLLWCDEESPRPSTAITSSAALTFDEDVALLNEARPLCLETFTRFLEAETPVARTQSVISPVTTAARMVRFYDLNPWIQLDPKNLSIVGNEVIHQPGAPPAIVIHWNSHDGKKIDVLFRKDDDEWRLDWDHYARYSDYPWSLFLAGSGSPVGEFRLLARERRADARKNDPSISLMLYAPRFGHPGETVSQSPEFLVSRTSKDGGLLGEAFNLARSGKQVFGLTLPNLNPEGMIPVRVKIQRDDADTGRQFKIIEVLACHWYSVDDPGVVPPADAKSESPPSP